MLYHFELQMAGVVLLTAMAAGAVSLWIKRRREKRAEEQGGGEAGAARACRDAGGGGGGQGGDAPLQNK